MEKEARRIIKSELEKDAYTLNAIQGITHYSPTKRELEVEALLALQQTVQAAQQLEVQKIGELKAARDNAVKTERALHEALLAVKDQVKAQFGASSDEYQSIGLKKKTEYKNRTVKKKA